MTEFELIKQFFTQTNTNDRLICGVGDDAAVFNPPHGQQLVTCTDTLVSGRHFLPDTDPFSIGFKAVAVNLSDLAAMAATPHYILLALSLPKANANPTWLAAFSAGMQACCLPFGVQLIGGDTTASNTLTITVTAIGYAKQGVYRCGAQVGDIIMVSNTLGDAAYALHTPHSGLQHRLDRPVPRIKLGQQLHNIASAMIDISDGLYQDLSHICHASGVHAQLDLDKLPANKQLSLLTATQRWQYQLTGGDDYELLWCCPTRVLDHLRQHPTHTWAEQVTVIGKITAAETDATIVHTDKTTNSPAYPIKLLYNGGYIDKHTMPPFNLAGYQHFV